MRSLDDEVPIAEMDTTAETNLDEVLDSVSSEMEDKASNHWTSGEWEFYGPRRLRTERGITGPCGRGPLAGIDLVHYMHTHVVRRLDGRPLTEAQARLV